MTVRWMPGALGAGCCPHPGGVNEDDGSGDGDGGSVGFWVQFESRTCRITCGLDVSCEKKGDQE